MISHHLTLTDHLSSRDHVSFYISCDKASGTRETQTTEHDHVGRVFSRVYVKLSQLTFVVNAVSIKPSKNNGLFRTTNENIESQCTPLANQKMHSNVN